MAYYTDYKGIMRLIPFFCLLMMSFAMSASECPSPDAASGGRFPDFAYPREVEAKAAVEFRQAMKESNPIVAIRAAMMLNIADSKITPDSIANSLARYGSIVEKFQSPWRDLALLLEAQLLADVYCSKPYVFDERLLPVDSPDPEPLLWSGDQFKARIADNIYKVCADADVLDRTPVSEISVLLVHSRNAENYGMSAYDFAVYRMLSMIERVWGQYFSGEEVIPFGCDVPPVKTADVNPAASPDPMTILDGLIDLDARRKSDSRALLFARFRKLDLLTDFAARQNYSASLLELYPEGSIFFPEVIWKLHRSGIFTDEYGYDISKRCAMLKAALETESEVSGCLRELLASIMQESAQITVPSFVNSGDQIKLTGVLRNLKEIYALAIKADNYEDSRQPDEVFKKSKDIRCLGRFSVDSVSPLPSYDTLAVISPEPGYYLILPSTTPDKTGVLKGVAHNAPVMQVSDIMMFTSASIPSDAERKDKILNGEDPYLLRLYVVDASDGNPVKGASLVGIKEESHGAETSYRGETNASGYDTFPGNINIAKAAYGKSNVRERVYSPYYNKSGCKLAANILTDLALYHPGDSIKGVVIVSENNGNILSPGTEKSFELRLRDANFQELRRLTLMTDSLGRAPFELLIPSDGLTGRYRLETVLGEDSENGYAGVEVAEYKAPSLIVTTGQLEIKDGRVVVGGAVTSYSGMPLAGSEVTVSIRYNPVWWRSKIPEGKIFVRKLTTSSDGTYELSLETSPLEGLGYDRGFFSVTVSAVSQAGESADAAGVTFALGKHYSIQTSGMTLQAVGEDLRIPVKVTDQIGNPVDTDLEYILEDPSGKTMQGICRVPALILKSSEIGSGRYKITFRLPESMRDEGKTKNAESVAEVTVWRLSDSKPPVETSLWLPLKRIVAEKGKKTVSIPVGSSYQGSGIYMEVADRNTILRREWLTLDAANKSVEVEAPVEGQVMRVTFLAVHNAKMVREYVDVWPAASSITPKIKVDTFRDRISSGSTEKWKFTFIEEGLPIRYAGMSAVLSNAALNAITPFSWSVNPGRILDYTIAGSVTAQYTGFRSVQGYLRDIIFSGNYNPPAIPEWYLWGQRLFSSGHVIRLRGVVDEFKAVKEEMTVLESYHEAPMMAYGTAAKMAATSGVADMDGVAQDNGMEMEETASVEEESDKMQDDQTSLRAMECPLAFFRPLLVTDADGVLELEFEVPDYNTTWQLQLLGYDSHMRTDIYRNETVSTKPVMVTTQMPRFALTSDHLNIPATVFNNTERPLDILTRIDVIEPESGKIIASIEEELPGVEASGSRVVNIVFKVPGDVGMLTVRTVARSAEGADGEQGPLVVLPSSQPVMDATTFYLAPGDTGISVDLPEIKPEDAVTVNYCANPSWYILTSLSGLIEPDSNSVLVLADALYANSVGQYILGKYPDLRAALCKAVESDDPDLTSPLAQNENLKLTGLLNTPWVNNAASETGRMRSLYTLADSVAAERTLGSLLETIRKARKASGGWSWMPQMKESGFVTERVIYKLGLLRQLGILPDPAREMMLDGLKFADKEKGEDYYRTVYVHKERFSLSAEVEYFYIRGLVTSDEPKGYIAEMKRDMMKRLPREWKELSLFWKATAALLLNDAGRKDLAGEIIRSVGQFAQYTREKGMWFDRSDDPFRQPSLNLNARVLDAFRAISPDAQEIERLAQYLVISRQVEDWNLDMSQSNVAEVVNAFMGVSSGWMESSSGLPEITLDGVPVELPRDAMSLAGNIYLNLLPGDASDKTLKVTRPGGGPAWGGVVRQFVKNPDEVKSQSLPQLKVEKRLLPIDESDGRLVAGKESKRFRRGDRIRVSLTVVTDRNLDYVMITDRMGAFMQPAEQLTSYDLIDGVWLLRETRRASTNFFITSLPKGKYVITYDVTADRDGEYSTGIATAQSQYYPLITAHSAGMVVTVSD